METSGDSLCVFKNCGGFKTTGLLCTHGSRQKNVFFPSFSFELFL